MVKVVLLIQNITSDADRHAVMAVQLLDHPIVPYLDLRDAPSTFRPSRQECLCTLRACHRFFKDGVVALQWGGLGCALLVC